MLELVKWLTAIIMFNVRYSSIIQSQKKQFQLKCITVYGLLLYMGCVLISVEVSAAQVFHSQDKKLSSTLPPLKSSIRILSFNVKNYFNGRVRSGRTYYSKSRGPTNKAAYERKKRQLLQIIRVSSADIVLLQEIENDVHHAQPAIEDLVQGFEKNKYELVRFSRKKQSIGYGSDAITQFILIKKAGRLQTAGVLRAFASSKSGAGRPLLLQEFRWVDHDNIQSFYVATSHLKSKRNSCGADQGCTVRRQKQAQRLNNALSQVQAKSNLPVLWVGDFNAQPHEPTMIYLRHQHWSAVMPKSNYSYVFRGQKMLLDHALWRLPKRKKSHLSIKLSGQVWNIGHHLAGRVSDHDPLIVDILF